MNFFQKLFGLNEKINNMNCNTITDNKYNSYDSAKIKEFTDKYNLLTREGIMSIPISEATKYPNVDSVSVVYMPEQILNRKATEYKKEKKYDLAIECLKKANELMPHSPFAYHRNDYERLVDMMVLAGYFEQAKEEHKKLEEKYGSRLMELKNLQKIAEAMGSESQSSYQKRVIDPYIEEANDREHYYWILENMPSLAPKSFGGYRNMKNKKTESYLKIVTELKQIGNDINNLKFWY